MADEPIIDGPYVDFPNYREAQADMWYVWCDADRVPESPYYKSPSNPYVKGQGIVLPKPANHKFGQ
jgi:hypothetical protein